MPFTEQKPDPATGVAGSDPLSSQATQKVAVSRKRFSGRSDHGRRGGAEPSQPPDLSEQEGDVVRLVGAAHGVDKMGTSGVQERLGGTQGAQEEVEPFVDGGVAGFDEAVGVEQEPVAGSEGDGDGVEADAADAEGAPAGR